MSKFIRISPQDNVAVLIADAAAGEMLEGETVLKESIARGHKVAINDIAKGENIIKYGYPIGHATADIKCGEWVHSHNLRTNLLDDLAYTYSPQLHKTESIVSPLTFDGYERYDGRVGIRNEFWIIPTVGCINGQAQLIIDRIKSECDITHLDDVRLFSHNYGCSQLGDDHTNTQKALSAIAKHPNAGAVLILGLGCENNQIEQMQATMGKYDTNRIKFLVAQSVEDEVEEGFKICKSLIELTLSDSRTPQPLSKLCIGLKCGGSDGLSGITANPLVGRFSDWLIARGGTTILTEVPEMFGAETILMNRAVDRDIFTATTELINNFKAYFRSHNQPIYENPSPGNKQGGITTLEEKSLGCTQKGGSANVVGVLKYGEQCHAQGLNLLTAPGNDLVAATALALSGAQIVLFTTGRGTPFGTFIPTMKLSTNSALYNFKRNWIDFNAGTLVEGEEPQQALERLTQSIIATARGKLLRHEKSGAKEIAIFKSGVTL